MKNLYDSERANIIQNESLLLGNDENWQSNESFQNLHPRAFEAMKAGAVRYESQIVADITSSIQKIWLSDL